MVFGQLQENTEEQEINKISYDEQGFQQVKEKFESMIENKEIILESNEGIVEFYINIDEEKYLIGSILYDMEENYLKMFEFVTANFYNYPYSKKVFEKLNYAKEDFIPEDLYHKVKARLSYLGLYMMYIIISFTKKQGFQLLKIEAPEDNATKFYYKVGKLFEDLGIIKKYHLPKYEKVKLGNYCEIDQKFINIEI